MGFGITSVGDGEFVAVSHARIAAASATIPVTDMTRRVAGVLSLCGAVMVLTTDALGTFSPGLLAFAAWGLVPYVIL